MFFSNSKHKSITEYFFNSKKDRKWCNSKYAVDILQIRFWQMTLKKNQKQIQT